MVIEISNGDLYTQLVPVAEGFYDAYARDGEVMRYWITEGMAQGIEKAVDSGDKDTFDHLLTPSKLPIWETFRRSQLGDTRPSEELTDRMENSPRIIRP